MECTCALAAGWITGLVLAGRMPLSPPWLVLVAGLGILAVRLRPRVLSCVLLALTASLLAAGGLDEVAAKHTPRGGTARLSLEVVRTACGARACRAEATLRSCVDVDPDSCVAPGSRIAVSSRDELAVGSRVAVLARLRPIVPFRNPMAAWAWPFRGVDAMAVLAEGVPVRIERPAWLGSLLVRGRKHVRRLFEASLAPPHNGVARALLLGEGNAVDADLNDAIRSSGVSHILAVSGMHVTVLAGALVWLLQSLWLRSPLALWWEARRAASALGVLLAPLVAAFAGGAPSAWRAAVMSALSYGLVAIGRRPDALAVCGASALISMLMEPHDALHPGFVLSVLATSALLTLTQAQSGWIGTLKESARTWIATAPFLSVTFGTLQVVSVAANVVLTPVAAALIPLVAAHALVGLWAPPLVALSARFFETASGAFVVGAKVASDFDPHLVLPGPSSFEALALSAVAVVWLTRVTLRTRLLVCAVAVAACVVEEVRLRHPLDPSEARFTFLDVGQGDSTLIEAGNGQHALIDAGGAILGGPDPGARSVLPLLRSLRVDTLDIVMLSHPHPDHYGGLSAVLENLHVRELWDTGQACAEDKGGEACKLLEAARKRGTRVLGPRELCGHARALGPLVLRVLAPCPGFDEGFGANDNSFVMRVEHGKRRLLFTGDVEHEGEAELLAHGVDLRADVLKIGHHGSKTSTTLPFLERVAPWLAVVSAGRGNRFGHPHPDVTARLLAHVPQVLRVDEVGGVRVRSDGMTLTVDAYDPSVGLKWGR